MFSQATLSLTRCFCLVLTAFALILALGSVERGALAQGTNTGGFQGQVRDRATGAAIPGATVRFTNRDFGTTSTSITDSNGTYSKSSLPVGIYDIEVSANGYNTERRQETLFAMAKYFINPNPFELSATVATPTPPVPVVDPDKPTPTPVPVVVPEQQTAVEALSLDPRRGGIFGRDQVQGLPLGSTTLTRTFDELAFYIPGVNPPPQAIGNSVGPGVGGGVGTSGQFSVNGLRSRANNFTVDASDNNDEDIGVRRQGFFTLIPQPIESIQEFQIITLLPPAEFGRNLGAQVNAISRSGSNQFHGHVWGMANFDRLNARNYFDNDNGDTSTILTANDINGSPQAVIVDGAPKLVTNDAGEKDKLTLLQGGFAVGGPIVREKIFFFASGEGQFLDGVQERHFAVPTVEQRGLFSTGAIGLQQCPNPEARLGKGGNCIPGFPTSVDGDAIFSLFPFANDPSGIYGRNTYTQALSTDARGYILSGRLDWNAFKLNGNQQTFTTRYNFTSDRRDLTDVGGALFSAVRPDVRTDNVSVFLNGSITNSLSNEGRFSWGRTRLRFDELPDATGFLQPIPSSLIRDPNERRFLLNAPQLFNVTLSGPCNPSFCQAAPRAEYESFGTTVSNSRLGPIGQLILAGFSPVGVDVFNFPQARTNDTYQFADTVRWQAGPHTISFGADIRRVFLNSDLPRNSRPLVTFNGALCFQGCVGGQSFLLPTDLAAAGAATGFFQSLKLPGTDASIRLSYDQLNFFVQDEFRFRSNLNVNAGLRYELNTTPKEADRKIEGTFGITRSQFPDPADVFGFDLFQGFSDVINGRTKIYEVDKNNFAPRIGLAWAPWPDTVIRGGYGIYYDQIIGSVVSQSRNVFPTFVTANTGGRDLCSSSFQLLNPIIAPFFGDCDGPARRVVAQGTLNTLDTGNLTFFDILSRLAAFPSQNGISFGTALPTRELDTPFSHQYSAGVEHRLFGNTFLSVAYVGTKGRSLLRTTTPNLGGNYLALITGINLVGNQPDVSGVTFSPFFNTDLERPNNNVGQVLQFETTGRSRYDSLQVGMRGRWSDRFRYNMNYVYGRAKDDVSDVFDLAGAYALPQNSLTFAGEYGPANFDIRHRFTYNFVYDLPTLKDEGGFAEFLLGGWTVSGVGKYYTGQPFTVNTVFDVNFDGNLTDRLDNLQFIGTGGSRVSPLTLNCTGSQCQSMLANLGEDGSVPRNNFRAGNVLDMDLSFAKRFTFAETQNIQLRIDLFNFINRANFGVPVRILEAPGFGSANDTITPQRRIQFGVKYSF